MTFVYSDSTAVVGPLATAREPHSWDLCVSHAGRITAPRGWELVRHPGPLVAPEDDDLVALADAVREGSAEPDAPARGWYAPPASSGSPDPGGADVPSRAGTSGAGALASAGRAPVGNGRRRGHLRVLPDPAD